MIKIRYAFRIFIGVYVVVLVLRDYIFFHPEYLHWEEENIDLLKSIRDWLILCCLLLTTIE